MKVKYNRVSTLIQTGDRFTIDDNVYDLTLLDKLSGSVAFKDRPKGKELTHLIEEGKIHELTIEEFSRLGRNTLDCMNVLKWLDDKAINVVVRNLGIQSRIAGKKNPIWNIISSVMSSLYELEAENIRERTAHGRLVYVRNGGVLGRPPGTNESDKVFLDKSSSRKILKLLKNGRTVREISKTVNVSTKTVMKVKNLTKRYQF